MQARTDQYPFNMMMMHVIASSSMADAATQDGMTYATVIGVYTPYSRKDICYNILARCIGGVDCENAIAD
jgi:hypothetical protein